MKEKYLAPHITIEEFKTVGMITTSGKPYPDDNEPDTDIEVPWN